MLQTSNYSLVLSLQFLLLSYDLFVNSFSELLRMAPVIQLVLFIIQDIAILFNIIIIFLMFFNTFVFQAGLVNLLFHKFKGTIILTAVYFALSISLHVWVMNLRWKNSNCFVWTDGLQTLFVFQRLGKNHSNLRPHFGPICGSGSEGLDPGFPAHHNQREMSGTAMPRPGETTALCPFWESLGNHGTGPLGLVWSCSSPETNTHSGASLTLLSCLFSTAAVLYCYFYKRTAVRLGDPRFYQDSLWLRMEFMQVRR
ncbi:transmembrane protein 138 isoform X2 [Bos taurus]|uniref:transmembrane protein 138 isoform X2 n=1 Tax=Bos taurus TaxID=9913 RepID=UPI00005C0660|nr:PREDICTED: transmembrane protein 138 isoform X1 [Bos mutus]XP_014338472.1 PREDICTED: transmembrane protein 138 isoform X1 [Bos mutus]XP_059738883.1 transmembrane protein 138 isoform X2 [Bos taurus]